MAATSLFGEKPQNWRNFTGSTSCAYCGSVTYIVSHSVVVILNIRLDRSVLWMVTWTLHYIHCNIFVINSRTVKYISVAPISASHHGVDLLSVVTLRWRKNPSYYIHYMFSYMDYEL